jgi:hypothetical protein
MQAGGCHATHLSSCRLAYNSAVGSGGALFVGGASTLRLVGVGACEAVAATEGCVCVFRGEGVCGARGCRQRPSDSPPTPLFAHAPTTTNTNRIPTHPHRSLPPLPSPSALSSAAHPNAPSLLATLASECGVGLGNTVLEGYGPIVATLPVGLAAGGDVRQVGCLVETETEGTELLEGSSGGDAACGPCSWWWHAPGGLFEDTV